VYVRCFLAPSATGAPPALPMAGADPRWPVRLLEAPPFIAAASGFILSAKTVL
jgi:hypothetical protein